MRTMLVSGELELLNTTEGLDHVLLIEKLDGTALSIHSVNEVRTHMAL